MSQQTEPKLQAPGAGLPLPQRLFLKMWLGPIVSKHTPPSKCRGTYEALTEKIIQRVSSVDPEKRKMKVLVDSIPGLEDSSRFWSLNGVLEHLLIVSRSVEGIILSLGSGKIPDGTADTARVKPAHKGEDYLAEFTTYAPNLMKRMDEKFLGQGMDFNSPLQFVHPWFGGITARQWYWLLSSHQGIHYKQVKGIMLGL